MRIDKTQLGKVAEVAPSQPLPIKYVDEIFNEDRLRGRMLGLMEAISLRAGVRRKFYDGVWGGDELISQAFVQIVDIVTAAESRVLDALSHEVAWMSMVLPADGDDLVVRKANIVLGMQMETAYVLRHNGNIYDLLVFTRPDFVIPDIKWEKWGIAGRF